MINFDTVREHLDYNPADGSFHWVSHFWAGNVGRVAGTTNASGYVVVRVCGKLYYAHRLAWLLSTGGWPKQSIDHINGNRADNRISNLRDVSQQVNVENLRGPQRNNTTGFIGVTFDKRKKRFVAQIKVNYKVKRLGKFKTAEEAHNAYLAAKRTLHRGCTI